MFNNVIKNIRPILTASLAFSATVLTANASVSAQEAAPFQPACEAGFAKADGSRSSIQDFAFWEGEWHVYDTETNNLMGFDDVKRDLAGCALVQHWRQLSDRFSRPGAPYRFSGRSQSGIRPTDGSWHQLWMDTEGSQIYVEGGLDVQGNMVLKTEPHTFKRPDGTEFVVQRIWTWAPKADGTIHNWGIIKVEGREDRKSFDVTYRRNVPGGAASTLMPK